MSKSRDEFLKNTILLLSTRVNGLCSNPGCQAPTKGPHTSEGQATNVGNAAHIHAAAPGGKRYDPSQTREARRSIRNGIWLCATCASLIDKDGARFPPTMLQSWKAQAEAEALIKMGKPNVQPSASAPEFDFTLDYKDVRITGEQHDYAAVFTLTNTGKLHLKNIEVELEFPTDLVPERFSVGTFQEARSNSECSRFLATNGKGLLMPIRAGEERAIRIPYRVDTDDTKNKGVFDRHIKARISIDGVYSREVKRKVREMQNS
jgi:hypothetical protein